MGGEDLGSNDPSKGRIPTRRGSLCARSISTSTTSYYDTTMKAPTEARQEVREAMQRLATTKLRAYYSRDPKRRRIEQQKVEEAEADLDSAEVFSRTVDAATALLKRVEVELASNDCALADSRPIVRRCNASRGASERTDGRTTAKRLDSKSKWNWYSTVLRMERLLQKKEGRTMAKRSSSKWQWRSTMLRMERILEKELLSVDLGLQELVETQRIKCMLGDIGHGSITNFHGRNI